jgi:hypothetical protein
LETSPGLNLPWVDDPAFETLLSASALDQPTRDKVEFFAREGYLILDLEIPGFEAISSAIITECSKRPEYSMRVMDAWQSIPAVRELALLPEILSLLRACYRREPIAMQTLNFSRGTEQKPHSDSFHFCSIPLGFMCGVWIALEPIDEDNGPVVYYPRSHKLPYLEHLHFGLTGSEQKSHELYSVYEDRLSHLLARSGHEPRTLTLPAGKALLWAGNLAHGGSPVRDRARTRHSMVTHYYFEDCLYYQPQRSDPFLGRIEWLDKKNVATGEYLTQMYNGRPARVRMSPLQRLKHLARTSGLVDLFRRVKPKRT